MPGPDRDARPWVNVILAVPGTQPGSFIVGHHHDRGRVFPGGRVNVFERLRVAAAREFREETGLEIAVGEQLCVFEVVDKRADYHKIAVLFDGTVTGGEMAGGDDLSDVGEATLRELIYGNDVPDLTLRIALWLESRDDR